MTGMGQDGLNGLRAMKARGAMIYAQDQATSVVWGMPSFVVREGLADAVLPVGKLAAAIEGAVSRDTVVLAQ
jgi:two-component system chemotaxis response regulator CheB